MNLPDRHLLLGMFLGAAAATGLAMSGPGIVLPSIADEAPLPPAVNTKALVKFPVAAGYEVTQEPWVDTTPQAVTQIKKIEGGRVSVVTIATTPTGVYSSDAIGSPHVQYPGIAVERVAQQRPDNIFRFWDNGGWSIIKTGDGGSFSYFNSVGQGLRTFPGFTCVYGEDYRIC